MCKNLIKHFDENYNNQKNVLIIDDGGGLISEVICSSKIFAKKPEIFSGIEQTNGGKNILLKKELPLYVSSVASSKEKIDVESNDIVRLCIEKIEKYFLKFNLFSSKILVIGAGAIGSRLYEKFQKDNFDCDIYDITHNETVDLSLYDVIIGATGANSISQEELSFLKKGVHLISVSSSDREFPSSYIRAKSILGDKAHDDFFSEKLGIYLANGGFPIIFDGGRVGCTPLEIDVTLMKILYEFGLIVMNKPIFENSINYLFQKKKSGE